MSHKALLLDLSCIKPAPAVVVALSGGMDSVALLHLCLEYFRQGEIKSLRAIHVHHGLSDNADEWASFCNQLCQRWQIPLSIERVLIQHASRKGLERLAREARYGVFLKHVNKDEYLFQGHHQNDQAETVIFRTLRGGDVHALSGIPMRRKSGQGFIYRPLLGFRREWINAYAKAHALEWVDDESNHNDSHDRNFIRHHIIPAMEKRWSGAVTSLSETAEHCADACVLLDEVASDDLQTIQEALVLPFVGTVEGLHFRKLARLSRLRQKNVLKFWFKRRESPLPTKACLERILDEMLTSAQDKRPIVCFHGITLRRHQDWILIDDYANRNITLTPGSLSLDKDSLSACFGAMSLRADTVTLAPGKGVSKRVRHLDVTFRSFANNIPPFAIYGRTGKKPLKKWLNELKVPYWIRDSVPLLLHEGQLVAVPGILINEAFCVKTTEAAWDFSAGLIYSM